MSYVPPTNDQALHHGNMLFSFKMPIGNQQAVRHQQQTYVCASLHVLARKFVPCGWLHFISLT